MEILNSFVTIRENVPDDLKLSIKSFYVFKTKKNENYDYYNVNTLFVTIDDKVFGFGQNDNGVCGQGCNEWIENPLLITELCDKSVIEFFNGEDFVLCLTSDNHIYDWGKNDHGQLGIGCVKVNRFYEPQFIQTFGDKKIVQVCCGKRHSLVLTEEGVVYGWGDNRCGQTGVGQEGEQVITSPKQWPINSNVTKIHCSRYQSFAITECGRVYCCGRNYHCQLGSDIEVNKNIFAPILHHDVDKVESIITSNTNTYFLMKNGDFYFCGEFYDHIGIRTKINHQKKPLKLTHFNDITNVFTSKYIHFIPNAIIFDEVSIYEFQYDEILRLDYITPEEYFAKNHEITYKTFNKNHNDDDSHQPSLSTNSKYLRYLRNEDKIDKFSISDKIQDNLKRIIKYFYIFKTSYNELNILFVTIDDKVFGLGINRNGVLGLGHESEVEKVEIIPELCDKEVKHFYDGDNFVLCLTNNNVMYGWGKNNYCQIGHDKNRKTTYKPKIIDYFNEKNIVQICCGGYFCSVLTSDGNVNLWGKYDAKIIKYPIECKLKEEIESIYCIEYKTFCLTKNGRVFYWIYQNKRLTSICIDTMSNIDIALTSYLQSETFIIFISLDFTIYIFKNEFDFCQQTYKIIKSLNFDENLRAFNKHSYNSVIFNDNRVYEFKFDETYEGFWETKFNNPFDYYCDKYGLTFETILLNVKKDLNIAKIITSVFNNKFISEKNDLVNILKPFQIANKILNLVSDIKCFHVFDINNMLFVTNDDQVFGFGLNQFGLCGFGHNNSVSEPQLIDELCYKNVINFYNGETFAMALTSENELCVWGVISDDEDNSFSIPRIIFTFESEISKICCSRDHSLILTKEGIFYGWGNNNCGQIERGQAKFITYLFKFKKLESTKLIACCNSRSFAVNQDNKISIWGINTLEIKNYHDDISNICVTDSLDNYLYILSKTGNIACFYSKTKSFKILKCHDKIEAIESIKLTDMIALTQRELIYKIRPELNQIFSGRFLIKTKYKTLFDYCAEEFQMTYNTIDVKLQNVIQMKSLKVTDKISSSTELKYMEKIGEGGFGKVFKVKDPLHKFIAIKKINLRNQCIDMEDIEREIQILSKIKSERVVRYLKTQIDNNNILHIHMEYCSDNLKNILEHKPKVFKRDQHAPMEELEYFISCKIFIELLEALKCLHEESPPIIHRDIKPGNVLFCDKGVSNISHRSGIFFKLCDFGVSKIYDDALQLRSIKTNANSSLESNSNITQMTNDLSLSTSMTRGIGTKKYMAPEIWNRKYDTKVDIYSLGVVARQLFGLDMDDWLNEENHQINQFEAIKELLVNMTKELPDDRPNCSEIMNNHDKWCLNGIPSNKIKPEDIESQYGSLKKYILYHLKWNKYR